MTPAPVQLSDYATITPEARDAFAKLRAEINRMAPVFMGQVAPVPAVKRAIKGLSEAEELSRVVRRELRK